MVAAVSDNPSDGYGETLTMPLQLSLVGRDRHKAARHILPIRSRDSLDTSESPTSFNRVSTFAEGGRCPVQVKRSLKETFGTSRGIFTMILAPYLLAVVGICTAIPAAQQDQGGDNVDALITSVFGKPSDQQNQPKQGGGSLDDLITDLFGNSTTTAKTILGIENQPKKDENEDCECVPYYQCRDGKILDNGIGLIDIRITKCDNYLDVCCKAPNIVTNPEQRVTPPPTVRKGCGVRHPEGVGFRITGDTNNEAQFGEFPWMVAILKEENVGNKGQKLNVYQCGGALIHPKVVLTAAHCVKQKAASELQVRAGEWDTQTKNEVYPHQDRKVQTVIVHEKYHSGALYNDYALLILTEPVELAENVDVVCLPEPEDIFDGSRCFASGWGKDLFGKEGHYQVILKRVELPIVSRDTCQNSLRSTRLGKYFILDSSFICAGGEAGKDTCKGDGGSPLVCPLKSDPTRFVQAGIVAWGIGCGENNTPGVYANVAQARQWIDEQMILNDLGVNSYLYNSAS